MKLKKLLILLKPYIIWIILALILSLIEAATTYFTPIYIQKIIEIVVPTGDLSRLKEIISFLLLLEVVSLVSTFVLKYIFSVISNEYMFSVKKAIVETCFKLKNSEIENAKGMLITIMNNDIYYLQAIITNLFPQLIIDFVSLIAIIIVLFKINYVILLIIVLFYPCLVWLQFYFNKKIRSKSKEYFNNMDNSNKLLNEFIRYLQDYICLHAKRYFKNRFVNIEKKNVNAKLSLDITKECNSIAPSAINSFSMILVLFICSLCVIDGTMNLSGLTIFIMYINSIFSPSLRIMMAFSEFEKIKVSLKRISLLLE